MSKSSTSSVFRSRRRLVVVALVLTGVVLLGLLAWSTLAQPSGPTLTVSGQAESTNGTTTFSGQVSVADGRNVTLSGVQVQILDADGRVLRTIRYESIDGSTPEDLTVTVESNSIAKVRVRFEDLSGTDSITVHGLRKNESGDLESYPESPDEYQYARGR